MCTMIGLLVRKKVIKICNTIVSQYLECLGDEKLMLVNEQTVCSISLFFLLRHIQFSSGTFSCLSVSFARFAMCCLKTELRMVLRSLQDCRV